MRLTAPLPAPLSALARPCSRLLVCALALWLSACTHLRDVDSAVQAFSTITQAPQPSTYRLERLPSQVGPGNPFAALEPMVAQALAKVGLQPSDTSPRLAIQVNTEASTLQPAPYAPGFAWGIHYHSYGLYTNRMLREQPPALYRRAVSVVMRDTQTQQVVYETRAVHEDVWTDDPRIYGVLLQAALQSFPYATQGERRVRLPMPPPTP
jgi:hypothetical protein